jgi:hypothetical protein
MTRGQETQWLNFSPENWVSRGVVESEGLRKVGSVWNGKGLRDGSEYLARLRSLLSSKLDVVIN